MASVSRIWGGKGSSLGERPEFRKETFQWRHVTEGGLAGCPDSQSSVCPRGPVAVPQQHSLPADVLREWRAWVFWSSPFLGSGSG